MRKQIVIGLIVFGLLIAFAACNSPASTPVVTTPSSTLTPTPAPTPTISVLEVGQGAQFPGYIVTLRRVVWEGDTLDTYWMFQNNGDKEIKPLTWMYPFLSGIVDPVDTALVYLAEYMAPFLSATDNAGNTGELVSGFSPQWDDQEKTLPQIGSSSLWPGQTAIASQSWKFGPLSKGIRVTFTYIEYGQVGNQVKQYQVMWNTGR